MCLLLYVPKGKTVKEEWLAEGYRCNSHGAGIAWNDPKDGRVWIQKAIMSYKAFQDVMKEEAAETAQSPMLIHFRIASVGKRIPENTHPFPLGNSGWVMAHNGTVRDMDLQGDESDTSAFARDVLTPLMENNPDQIFDPDTKKALEEKIGGSKMLLFGPDGAAVLLNERFGHWKEDVWFSNTSYIPYVAPTYPKYHHGGPGGGAYGWGDDDWTEEEWQTYLRERSSARAKSARLSEIGNTNRSTSTYEYSPNGNWFRIHTTVPGQKMVTGEWCKSASFEARIKEGKATTEDYYLGGGVKQQEDWRQSRIRQKRWMRAMRSIQKEVKDGNILDVEAPGCYCEQCGTVLQQKERAYQDRQSRVIMCRECTIDLFVINEAKIVETFQTPEEEAKFIDPNTEQNLQLLPDLTEKGLTDSQQDLVAQELEEQERVMGVALHLVS